MLHHALMALLLTLFVSGCAQIKKHEQRQQTQLKQSSHIINQLTEVKSSLKQQQEGLEYIQQQNQEMEALKEQVDKANNALLSVNSQLNALNSQLEAVNEFNQQPLSEVPRAPLNCKQSNKYIVGEKEWVYLPVAKTHLKARIDSGATTSSISATDIEQFERDGETWVRFKLNQLNEQAPLTVERPLDRRVAIKQSSTDEKESRLVISLMVKMGDLSQNTQFTLTDRSNMVFPVLLGRSFLRDIVLIDVSKQYFQSKYQPVIEPLSEPRNEPLSEQASSATNTEQK